MKTEAIKAAQTLLESNVIDQEQFAKIVIQALNGHAVTAAQLQLSIPATGRKRTNHLSVEQLEAIVQMYVARHTCQIIAETVNKRYGLHLTKGGVASIVRDIRNGKKQTAGRYQTADWINAFAIWQKALS